jgi:2-hydroxy-3-keto-5-methylthiopentenyl-1-phosphate phosphatase
MYHLSSSENKETNVEKHFQYEIVLQKKMFFGNYKTRVLKMYRRTNSLFMSYWYLGAKEPKNEFELQMNDYAQPVGK